MKKLTAKAIVLFCIFALIAPHPAQALFGGGGFSINPVSMMNQVFDDLGVDKPELKNSIKTFNVSRTKKDAPTVKVSFDPAHPIVGEVVTATAQPNSFLNDSAQLYYTWYLKHKDETKNSYTKADYTTWKIRAMQMIARGGFESTGVSYASHGPDDSGAKSGYIDVFGGEGTFGVANQTMQKCFLHDYVSGDEYPMTCEHLFPDSPGSETGDGNFEIEEEKYWQTDPNEQDTLGGGRSDEANVAGLGAFQFSWVYQNGDEVMVAVEGTSIEPTQDKDASYKVMWALPKDKCGLTAGNMSVGSQPNATTSTDGPAGVVNPTTLVKTITETTTFPKGTWDPITFTETTDVTTTTTVKVYEPLCTAPLNTVDPITGNSVSSCDPANIYYSDTPSSETTTSTSADTNSNVLKTSSGRDANIEDCPDFDDNLVNPLDEGASQRLDVSLDYGPKSPINNVADPDRLIVSSTVLGAADIDNLKYEWRVSRANSLADVNAGKWNPLSSSEISELETANGIGLADLKFNLDLSAAAGSKFYLKVRVDVSKQLDGGGNQEGTTYVIIPVLSTDKKIDVYSTEATSATQLREQASGLRCGGNDMDGILCPVVKNEIIGLTINSDLSDYDSASFSWSVDGKKIAEKGYGDYTPGDATAYYPVLNELGNQFSISFSATRTADGQVLNLTKSFEVVEPKVEIVCAANSASCDPELLGYYVNLDGTKEADYSPNNFNVTQGAMISLTTTKNMPFENNIQWYVDSVPITSDASANPFSASVNADTGVLSLPANKNLDDAYIVTYSSDYFQDRNIMSILNENHGVQFNSFYEKKMGDTVNLKVAYVSTISSANTKHKSLASLVTNTSNYLNFLFRIVLTMGLFLFVTRILFSLTPTRSRE